MPSLENIRKPILSELEDFDKQYRLSTKSEVALMQEVVEHVLSTQGKQMRPIFTILSAGLLAAPTQKTVRAAIMLEILHTASLMHDDVVDNSSLRRNHPTVNHLFDNKIAILSGDYFLAVVLRLLSENQDYEFVGILSNVVREMASGELLQQQKSTTFDISEKGYFEIIEKKTGVLIASCCQAGAVSIGAKEQEIQKLWEIGILVGTAFQIKDDILDYLPAKTTGKTQGNDLRELKFTLPLLYYFQQKNSVEQKILLSEISAQNQNEVFVQKLMNNIEAVGAITYAQEKVESLCNQSLVLLSSFPDSPYKKSFSETIKYVMQRNC